MTDPEFLWWLHERLAKVHRDNEMLDFMHHLRAIIVDMPKEKATPRVARMDTDADVLRKRFGA